MPKRTSKTGSELFIVDNSDADWKVVRYLHDWCQISRAIDIATGYFEIGALLALKNEWQNVDEIRILMGDEVSLRTRDAFGRGFARARERLEDSLEDEKRSNDFLIGVPAIVEAIRAGKIVCRVYRKEKFHAKAYITHARLEVVGSSALVGSSNFTYPGLTENIELNVQITGAPVNVLQEWYEEHWDAAEDVTAEILRIIERHTREHTPFEVYAKALHELHRRQEMSDQDWLNHQSKVYPVLDQYQKDGFHRLVQIANARGGAFLCDGVGLGKTFVGLMLLEYLIEKKRKRVVLFVPKSGREPVWEPAIHRYLPHLAGGHFSSLAVFNHTDLQRGGQFAADMRRMKAMADVVLIDEAHHFRNRGFAGSGKGIQGTSDRRPSRYFQMFDLIGGPDDTDKQVFLLTATPINNRLIDLQHMIELFSREKPDYFRSMGIHSLPGHFRRMENELQQSVNGEVQPGLFDTDLAEAERVLVGDTLFRELVVQRSRAYVKESQVRQGGAPAVFPVREDPKVADYSIKKTYGRLLDMVEQAFNKQKPLFSLAIYYPLAYYTGPDTTIDRFAENRQEQVVGLIRTGFLKRFESSAHAFERSCDRLFMKLLAFFIKHSETPEEKRTLEKWLIRHKDLTGHVKDRYETDLFGEPEDEADEDLITEEMLEDVRDLSRDDYDVPAMLSETRDDLDQLADFLNELEKFEPKHDDKLKALLKLLKTDPVLKKNKVLIFSEFSDTAHYLKEELVKSGIAGVEQIDSGTKRNRAQVIRCFAPYYNGSSSAGLAAQGLDEIRVLISTDVLSEGLNLQDATRLINYDLHWNPVRLMQRIGRVDRRLNPEIESRLVADHPEQSALRGKVAYWNFLPPDELNALLTLWARVTHKTLRISRTFGIEGRKLLRPDDDFEALRNFNHQYEGETTAAEEMQLEYQQLLRDHPGLADRLNALPGRVFSGKRHPTLGTRAVFFCFALPAADHSAAASENGDFPWTEEAGRAAWYLYDLASEKIEEEPTRIIGAIRCQPDTPRHCVTAAETLSQMRAKLEMHIKNTYLKSVQAPIGVKPALKAWLELS
jgi:Helicase conserved C-terminal domain/PLD-like domain